MTQDCRGPMGVWKHAEENRALRALGSVERVLMLQGPVGPFFRDLATLLEVRGVKVLKINFNGGDQLYFPRDARRFDGTLDEWSAELRQLVHEFAPQALVVFGQDRAYHSAALALFRKLGLVRLVFEEGYIRPNYVTFEPDGVNAQSTFDAVSAMAEPATAVAEAPQFELPFSRIGTLAARYFIAATAMRNGYPFYEHHRSMGLLYEAHAWLRSGARKLRARGPDARTVEQLVREDSKRYFFVPLQVHLDAQMTRHSPYYSVGEFIEQTVESFARHAPADHSLVFKHHPLDRGHRSYRALIARLAREHGIASRLHYLREAHTPTLLEHARGTVTVNSTVGFTSLFHRTPLKVLGSAIFDWPGLSDQQPLEDFWRNPGGLDETRYIAFRSAILRRTQLPGSFYSPQTGYEGLLAAVARGLGSKRPSVRPTASSQAGGVSTTTPVDARDGALAPL